jgi:alkylhydroperoxidase family enzyme
VLANADTADISQPLRATLHVIKQVSIDHTKLTSDHFTTLRQLGISRQAVVDALDVAYLFNIITRIADALGFYCGPDQAFEMSATRLLKRGYK